MSRWRAWDAPGAVWEVAEGGLQGLNLSQAAFQPEAPPVLLTGMDESTLLAKPSSQLQMLQSSVGLPADIDVCVPDPKQLVFSHERSAHGRQQGSERSPIHDDRKQVHATYTVTGAASSILSVSSRTEYNERPLLLRGEDSGGLSGGACCDNEVMLDPESWVAEEMLPSRWGFRRGQSSES